MDSRKHILIADPEAGFLYSAEVALRKAGYRTSIATNGLDALYQAVKLQEEGEAIDLVITNCGMPDLPGAELLFALRRFEVPVPVFVIAEHYDSRLLADLAVAGCAGRIEKPFPPDELVRCVELVLLKKEAA